MDESVVVVGAGQAAAQLVASLRSEGFAGPITLIGEEAYIPYQRPPLSKAFLAGELAAERLIERRQGSGTFVGSARLDARRRRRRQRRAVQSF